MTCNRQSVIYSQTEKSRDDQWYKSYKNGFKREVARKVTAIFCKTLSSELNDMNKLFQ